MSECNFNVGDRVKRLEGKEILGVVKEVRAELRKPGQKEAEASEYMIKVLWDSGTESYFGPEALKKV